MLTTSAVINNGLNRPIKVENLGKSKILKNKSINKDLDVDLPINN